MSSDPASWLEEDKRPGFSVFSGEVIDSAHGLSEGLTEDELEWTKESLCKAVNVVAAPAVVVDTATKEIFHDVSQQSRARSPVGGPVAVDWSALQPSAFFPVSLATKTAPPSLAPVSQRGNLDSELAHLLNSSEGNASTPVRRGSGSSHASQTVKLGTVVSPAAPVAAPVSVPATPPVQAQLQRTHSRSPPTLPAKPFPLSWSHFELHGETGAVFSHLSDAFHKHAMDHSFDPSSWTFFCHLQQPQRRLLGWKLPSCHKQMPSFRVRVFSASAASAPVAVRAHVVEFSCSSGVAPRLFRGAFDNIVGELSKVPGLLREAPARSLTSPAPTPTAAVPHTDVKPAALHAVAVAQRK